MCNNYNNVNYMKYEYTSDTRKTHPKYNFEVYLADK